MGGADKGLVEYAGRPLVAHAIERLLPQVDGLLISANRNLDIYSAFGYPVLPDTETNYPGPLAGLAAGLAACRTPWLLCVPCDCPHFPLDLAQRLHAAAETAGACLAVARSPEGLQPTFQLCHRDLLPALRTYLAGGERKVGTWCRSQGAVEVSFADPAGFDNLNCRDDLRHRS